MSFIAQDCKEKRNPNVNEASFIKSEEQKLTSLEITIKVTAKLDFCLVPQKPNEELQPPMRLRMPCPGRELDDGQECYDTISLA